MASLKADLGDIDEDFLLDSIKGGGSVELDGQKQKESPKRKRASPSDYGSTYLMRNEIKARHSVYISCEIHAKILKIVSIIGDKEISVGGYIDTVLTLHLDNNRDAINELYRRWKQNEELV